MPETKRRTTRSEKIVKPGVYETTDKPVRAAKAKPKAKVAAPVKAPQFKRPAHRPSDYSEEIADEICWRLTHGEPYMR
jgi:hypothetical protein